MAENHDFKSALLGVKIPILILDQKWHRLFALGGKPADVQQLESEENMLLKRQAELKQELKDLKRVKETLMSSVMNNMQATSDLISKKLDEDKRLLEECNDRIASNEDELLDIPHKLDEVNYELMLLTMDFCYEKLRINTSEAEEIANWIKDIRVQLKKNIVRKKNREINNKEIYSYMHDVFGMEILNIFDIDNEDFSLGELDDHLKEGEVIKVQNPNIDKIKLEEVDLDQINKEVLDNTKQVEE